MIGPYDIFVKTKQKTGISLIVLVIMILVMIILASVTLFILSETGVIERANEARFKATMKSYVEAINVYISDKHITDGNVNIDNINVTLSTSGLNTALKEIIPNVKNEHIKYISIEKGVLIFNVVDTDSKDDLKYGYWACQIGIKVKDFDSCDDIYNADKKPYYIGEWLDDLEVNAPDFTGFNIAKTRYVYHDSNGIEIIGDTIDKAPPKNWFDYMNNKWANIVVENVGNKTYLVWIPRYEYIVNANKTTTINYIRKSTIDVSTGLTLEYKIPESFTWDSNNISGFWATKYELQDYNNYSVNFEYVSYSNKIKVTNVVSSTPTSGTIEYKYLIAKEGETLNVKETNSNTTYEFKGLLANTNYDVNVQVYNVIDGVYRLLGDAKKTISTYVPETPIFTGFIESKTKYVTWDESGNEILGNTINLPAPTNWYNYSEMNWANIVVENGNNKAYLVWIPRYEFLAYKVNGVAKVDINFIPLTKLIPTSEFKIPEAFTWDSTPISGFWSTKYELQDYNNYSVNFEYVSYSDKIKVTNVVSSTPTSGTIEYKYLIAKEGKPLDVKETSSNTTYEFTKLLANTNYDVNVQVYNVIDGVYRLLGDAKKTISTYVPETPIFTGFIESKTKYVTWDESGNEILGNTINLPAPTNWYNYSEMNWANIVVENGNNKAYLVWIPRYEFLAYKVNGVAKVDINFIPLTKLIPTSEFKIPEAFTWDSTPISGFWSTKYELSNNT